MSGEAIKEEILGTILIMAILCLAISILYAIVIIMSL